MQRVISGGQTGADQGGLLAAHALGVQTGGTAPENFLTSSGPNVLLRAFGLVPKGTLKSRTEANVRDSDGTVIIAENLKSAGSTATRNACKVHGKPYLELSLLDLAEYRTDTATPGEAEGHSISTLSMVLYRWIREHQIAVLNVAGNREKYDRLWITTYAEAIVLNALLVLDSENELRR